MKKLMFVAVATAAMAAVAETGVWTQRETPDGGSDYTTVGNWQNGYVPNHANDSVDLSAFASSSHDRSWWYGSSKSVFQNIELPAASTELVLDDIVGGRQNRLRGKSSEKNLYSFLNMSRYLGSIQLFQSSELRMRVAANETQELHKLVVSGTPALKVEDGVVELGNLCGVGTLVKTGAGELKLSGVTSANGVRLKVSEGQLTLKGIPANPTPAGDPAAHFDFSDASTLTIENGGVAQAADVRGPGYHTLTPLWGAKTPIVKYGDLQLLNFGNDSTDSASDPAVWGSFGGMACDATIDHVRTMFVVYRYNSSDFNGAAVFPVNSQSGNDMRRPPDTIDTAKSAEMNANVAKLCDWSAYNLFFYQQYSAAYQCYASQFIVTGDIRRNGEPVVYNETPRGFRDELEVMSFNFNTNHLAYTPASLDEWNFKYVARAQDAGPTGGSQIGEILVYTNALTDAEQKQTIDYLMAKWGKAEGKRPWIASSVGGALKTTVNVPAGETAYVKAIDTTSGALVKTGEGKLVARQVDGDGVIKVEGGSVEFVGGLKPVESGKGEFLPAPGMNAHFDASVTDGMVFDSDGKGIVRWNSSVTNNRYADWNEYLAVSNATKATLTGKIPFLTTDAANRKWVDFGDLSVTSAKTTDTPNSGWFRVTRSNNGKDNSNNHVREIFWVWKTRPAADGQNPVLCGAGESDWWRYVRPGKGTMINPTSAYSDSNHLSFLKYRNAQWAVDGKVVDPTTANYPSDVHVVRVSLPEATYFCGVGNDDHYVKGGFQLGQLITYSRELTDRERVDTETYLLRKWTDKDHPDYVGAAPTATSVLYPADVTDVSAGEGAVVQIDKLVSDVTEPTFFSGETVGIHLDASRLEKMTCSVTADGKTVCDQLDDPRANGMSGAPQTSHKPKVLPYRQNGRTVLDLGQKGNNSSASTDSSDLKFNLNGFRSDSQCASIIVYSNQPNSDQYANIYRCNQWWSANSLWVSGGSTSFFAQGTSACVDRAAKASVWIDGTNIGSPVADGSAMPAGFHVVVINNDGNNGWATDGVAGYNAGNDNCGGMLFCEVITFTKVLTSAQVTEATEYLMKKWGIGQTAAETPELTSVSAAKGGKVKLAMAVNATALSGSGTIDAPAVNGVDTINAKLLADSVEGPTLTGTLSLAATGVINVTLGEGVAKPQPGVYPIISGATLASDTAEKLKNWTLNVPEVKCRTFALKVVDGAICLDVGSTGMMVIIQ